MSNLTSKILLKALAPKVAFRVVESFDRITTLVVGISWAAAALMIGFALYTVNISVNAKRSYENAQVAEPALPTLVRKKLDGADMRPVLERLQHRYPDIKFDFRGVLVVTAADGTHFHDWLTSLDYLDTISPDIRWTMIDFCVGKCSGRDLMSATLTGEKVNYEKPTGDDKK